MFECSDSCELMLAARFLQVSCGPDLKKKKRKSTTIESYCSVVPVLSCVISVFNTSLLFFLPVPVLYPDNDRHPQPLLKAEPPPPAPPPPQSLHLHVGARPPPRLGLREPGRLLG